MSRTAYPSFIRASHVKRKSGVLGQISATVFDCPRTGANFCLISVATASDPFFISAKVHTDEFHIEGEVESGLAKPTAGWPGIDFA